MIRNIILETQYGYDVLIGQDIEGSYEQLLDARNDQQIIAPMYLLFENWRDIPNTLSGSDEITGIDVEGKYTEKGKPVIITLHGGIDGGTVLTADVVRRANRIYDDYSNSGVRRLGDHKGFTGFYGLDLEQSSTGQAVIDDLLCDHKMPDGTEIPVYILEDVWEGRTPQDFTRFAVVRTMKQSGKQNSFGKNLYKKGKDGEVTWVNPQLLVFANGVDAAVKFADSLDFYTGDADIVRQYPLNGVGYQEEIPQGFKPNMHWGSVSLRTLRHQGRCNAIVVSVNELLKRRELGTKPKLEQITSLYADRKSQPYTPCKERDSLFLRGRFSC